MITVPRSAIVVTPDRQRGALTPEDVAELADSIRQHGLLHPPVVERQADGTWLLLAGETRLAAISLLAAEGETFRYGSSTHSLDNIPVNQLSDLSEIERFEIELEENVRRKAYDWHRQVLAYNRLHKMKLAQGLSYRDALRETQAQITQTQPEDLRGYEHAHQNVILGEHLSDPEVAGAKTKKDALKIVARKLRKAEDARNAATAALPAGLVHGDALETLATFADASFDGTISDPPYGIGITQLSYQHSSEQKYDDSYENWQRLMPAFATQLKRVLKPNASGYLFCDLSRFEELRGYIEAAGFEVYPRPFIWDRSPDGRLTTPEKWPRRCYECILYFRRGDRPLFEIRSDVLRYPADRNEANYHGAKKPVELYLDLLQRSFRPGDHVFDAFAGSGPLYHAAKKMGVNATLIEGDDAYFSLLLRLTNEVPNASV